MHQYKVKDHTGAAGRAKGQEFVIANTGERHYTNHSPRFSVHYYPQKEPEQLLYVSWEEHYLLHGYDLLETYETLKANVTDVIRQSQGPREVGKPYIEKIEFLLRP